MIHINRSVVLTAPAAVFPKEKPETLHRMSALGQKQTCAVQNGMSASPPKATTSGPPLQIIRWNGAFRATRFPARGLGKQQGSDRKQDPKPATDAATIIACASCTSHGTDHRVVMQYET